MRMGWVLGWFNIIIIYIIGFFCEIIKKLYYLIILLADVNFFSNETFLELKDRFFSFIALFMLFKLAFSIIQYIVNPDKMTESTTGAQKLLVRVIISLVMLTAVDTAFDKAMEFQNIVISKGIINNIIFGSKDDNSVSSANSDINSDDVTFPDFIAYTLTAPFITWNDNAFYPEGDSKCESSPFEQAIADIKKGNDTFSGDCFKKFTDSLSKDDNSASLEVFKKYLKKYNLTGAFELYANTKYNSKNVFSLNFFTPLLLIIFMIILLVIAVRVAVRAVKLSMLHLIAPLPIISYIDPNEKDGMFKKWWKLVLKTYLELFIQLASFFFSVFIITNIFNMKSLTGYSGTSYKFQDYKLLYLFIVIGAFMFAFQVPKLISDLTGANTEGISKGMKKGAGIIGSAAIGGLGGYLAGSASRIAHTADVFKDKDATTRQKVLSLGSTAASILFGGLFTNTDVLGSAIRSGYAGSKGGNIFSNANKGITGASVARNAGWIRDSNGNGVRLPIASRISSSFSSIAGLKNSTIGEGRLKDDKRTATQALNEAQYKLQDLMSASSSGDTISAYRKISASILNSAESDYLEQRSHITDIDDNFFTNNDLSTMNFSSFSSALQTGKSNIISKHQSGSISDDEYNRRLDSINSFAKMSKKEFEDYKNSFNELSTKYNNARNDYNNSSTISEASAMKYVSDKINDARASVESAQKKVDKITKNIETLNKSNGR